MGSSMVPWDFNFVQLFKVDSLISLSFQRWDSWGGSFNFKRHPLVLFQFHREGFLDCIGPLWISKGSSGFHSFVKWRFLQVFLQVLVPPLRFRLNLKGQLDFYSRSNRPLLKLKGHPGHLNSNPEGPRLEIEKTTRRPPWNPEGPLIEIGRSSRRPTF